MDDIDMSTVGGAQLSIGVIDAIKYVDSHRSEIGGFQNRVSGTMDNLNTVNRSVTESKGRIRDTDFARESTEMVRSQVLQDDYRIVSPSEAETELGTWFTQLNGLQRSTSLRNKSFR